MKTAITCLLMALLLLTGCQAERTVDTPVKPEPVDLPGVWETMADMPTVAQENSVTEMDGKLYLSGGMKDNDFSEFVKKIYQYDPVTDSWSEFADFDRQIHHHASAAVNGVLYFIGGYSGPYPDGSMLANVYSLDSITGLWEEKAPLPQPIAAGTSVCFQDEIYFFGGTLTFNSGEYNADVLKYSPARDQWEKTSTFTRTREHMSAVLLEGRIYIVGGRKYAGGFTTYAYMDAYDPTRNEWQQLPDIPVTTSASLVAVWDRKVYTFGGEMAKGSSSFSMLHKSFEYTPETGQWREVEHLPLHGTIAVTLGPGIYVAGGGDKAGIVNAQSTTYKFTIND